MSDTPAPSPPTASQPSVEGPAAGDAPTSDVSTPGCPICEFIEAGPCGGQHKVKYRSAVLHAHLVCVRACMQPHFRAVHAGVGVVSRRGKGAGCRLRAALCRHGEDACSVCSTRQVSAAGGITARSAGQPTHSLPACLPALSCMPAVPLLLWLHAVPPGLLPALPGRIPCRYRPVAAGNRHSKRTQAAAAAGARSRSTAAAATAVAGTAAAVTASSPATATARAATAASGT